MRRRNCVHVLAGYPTVRDELAHRGSMSPPASPAIRKLGAPASPSLGSGRFYVLTGKTGSLLYMAPEVFRGDAYNCKVRARVHLAR